MRFSFPSPLKHVPFQSLLQCCFRVISYGLNVASVVLTNKKWYGDSSEMNGTLTSLDMG